MTVGLKLYKHQEEFLKLNPKRHLISAGAGTGKTLMALLWLKQQPETEKLVVCPKQLKQRGIDDLKERDIKADVLTKEEIKKTPLDKYNVMVIDEAHFFNSPIFVKGRSQMTETIYNGLRAKPDAKIILLTATPISSQPGNLHTLLTFAGKYIDGKKYRDYFYELTSPRYMKGRKIYTPVSDGRTKAKQLQLKYAFNVKMEDIVDFIPKQYYEVVNVPLPNEVKKQIDLVDTDTELESDIARWYAKHKLEQHKGKIKKIKELSQDHSKVVIFAKYKEQITELEKELSKERYTLVMTGDTKNQEEIIKKAQEASEVYFIIQADISEGYELPDFTCVIYASQSWRKISDIQSQARVQRINNLKSNWYYWLISGEKDMAVYKAIEKGNDFVI